MRGRGGQRAWTGGGRGMLFCRQNRPPKSGIDKAKIYGIIIVYCRAGRAGQRKNGGAPHDQRAEAHWINRGVKNAAGRIG